MTHEEQLKVEELNRKIIDNIIKTVKPEDFINFYLYHNQKETCEHFGLRTTKQLVKVLKLFNYDFSTQKPSKFRGKPAARSHESYVEAGKKSSETQQQHWAEKSDEEKAAWSEKQTIAHSSESFRKKIKEINIAYQASLSPEEKEQIRLKKSKSGKASWSKLTTEQKEAVMQNRFKNGRCYNSKDSGPNEAFAKLLLDNNIKFDREFCLDMKRFDFKVENTLIEIDPWCTHNSTFAPFECKSGPLDKYYHKQKSEIAEKYNYRCIHVFDWDDQAKIIELLQTQKSIGARECEVRPVDKVTAAEFIAKHHIQNYAKDEIRIGLYYNNELVSLMTFGTPRYNKQYEYELIRYCSAAKVIGGAEKLFKAFVTKYNPRSVLSYCDLSKFSGKTYDKLGFTLLRKPAPSKHWYNAKTGEHYTDNLLRQQGFSRLVHRCDASEDTDLTTTDNETLMLAHGFVEIYDCGQATYIWQAE